jgi:catechol 2,3-dioxygenase-like lactoylglutathione lyase family enzyme
MQIHTGRLIDHVHLIAKDFAKSARFYKAILAALGREVGGETDRALWSDELYLSKREEVTHGDTHIHLAFQAQSRDAVKRFHSAGIEAGGRDNGAPGERHYHPGYYAAFLIDPDGNNVEAVHHGAGERSADAVTITYPG